MFAKVNVFDLNYDPIFIALNQTPCIADPKFTNGSWAIQCPDANGSWAFRRGFMPDRRRFMVLAAACSVCVRSGALSRSKFAMPSAEQSCFQPPQRSCRSRLQHRADRRTWVTDRIVGRGIHAPSAGGPRGPWSVDGSAFGGRNRGTASRSGRGHAGAAAHQLIDPMRGWRSDDRALAAHRRGSHRECPSARPRNRDPRNAERSCCRVETRLVAIAHQVKDLAKPRVIMITGRVGDGLVLVAKPNTYTGDAIVLAGGRFALEARALASVSPEAIFDADPDVLLFAGSEKDRDELLNRPGWGEMRAVRTKHVYGVSRSELLIPGPRVIDGIEHLAAVLHSPGLTQ